LSPLDGRKPQFDRFGGDDDDGTVFFAANLKLHHVPRPLHASDRDHSHQLGRLMLDARQAVARVSAVRVDDVSVAVH